MYAFLTKDLIGAVTRASMLGALASCSAMADSSDGPSLVTPPGITTVEVSLPLAFSQPEYHWTRLGDASGRTVFQYLGNKPGQPTDEADFVPVVARKDASAYGPWELVERPDGKRQWSFRGRALFTWKKEKAPGDVALGALCEETKGSKSAGDEGCAEKTVSLPKGWAIARYEPTRMTATPPSISVERLPYAQATALVDQDRNTIYAFNGDVDEDADSCETSDRCAAEWRPVFAPSVATRVGKFEPIARPDGLKQWAFAGRALYTYAGDRQFGDIKGEGREALWEVAKLHRDFIPDNVEVRKIAGRGTILATSSGQALYTRHPFEFRWGARNARDGFTNLYSDGKRLGTTGCDADCLKEWQPLRAPDDAVSTGYWEVYKRPDGSKQWAYKGFALYTNKRDTPGAVSASNRYEYVIDGERYASVAEKFKDKYFFGGGAGLFWHVAVP